MSGPAHWIRLEQAASSCRRSAPASAAAAGAVDAASVLTHSWMLGMSASVRAFDAAYSSADSSTKAAVRDAVQCCCSATSSAAIGIQCLAGRCAPST